MYRIRVWTGDNGGWGKPVSYDKDFKTLEEATLFQTTFNKKEQHPFMFCSLPREV